MGSGDGYDRRRAWEAAGAADFDLASVSSISGLPSDILNITLWMGWTSDLHRQKMFHRRRLLIQ
jgi:hypothetical protein